MNNNGLKNKYKLEELAEMYGFKRSTLRKWVNSGLIKGAIKIGFGKTSPYVLSKEDFETFIEDKLKVKTK